MIRYLLTIVKLLTYKTTVYLFLHALAIKMTCTNLDQLPSEIINLINSHLDLGSIQSLRRTTATISAKCHGHSWLRFFHTQETDLTAPSLARLSDIAAHKHLRTAIGNITVIAGINDANGNKESEEEVKLATFISNV